MQHDNERVASLQRAGLSETGVQTLEDLSSRFAVTAAPVPLSACPSLEISTLRLCLRLAVPRKSLRRRPRASQSAQITTFRGFSLFAMCEVHAGRYPMCLSAPFYFSHLSLQALEPPGAGGVPVGELVHHLEGHHLSGLMVESALHPAHTSAWTRGRVVPQTLAHVLGTTSDFDFHLPGSTGGIYFRSSQGRQATGWGGRGASCHIV